MYFGLLRGLACAASVALPTMVFAQDEEGSRNRVGAHTDWSVFEAESPKQCWSVSSPKEISNTQDGREVAVRRGEILFFVSFIPEADVNSQVSFTGGYPFRPGSTVTLTVGSESFDLFTVPEDDPDTTVSEDEMAWAKDATDDAKIIAAMKAGAEAKLIGFSARGTRTEDTFSLFGFTAAVEEAENRCADSPS
ncbi:MAG: invasion associated locus B family protein [Pseudomonadota bacterium]